MEDVKEKINKIFRLYFNYMLIAFSGAMIYILIAFLINYYNMAIIGLSVLIIVISSFCIYKYNKSRKINKYNDLFWLKITEFIYANKSQKEIFLPIMADWQEEYFEALSKKEIWKARWVNVRYTYAFLAAMWMKSPIGDLIQFVIKIAKP